jgi:DnaJ-class molecular chaperone
MITINNKFNVGDEIYTIVRVPLKYDCPVCKGTGAFVHNEHDIKCPRCCGSGKLHDNKMVNEATDKLIVTSLRVSFNGVDSSVRYKLHGNYKSKWIKHRAEDNIFACKEEAEQRALELNCPIMEKVESA